MRRVLATILCVVPASLVCAAPPAAARSPALKAILDEHYDWMMRNFPEDASRRGDERFNDRLTDYSPAVTARRVDDERDRLARLAALKGDDFTDEDRLDADLLRYILARDVEGSAFHDEQMPINAMDGPHIWLAQLCDTIPLRTEKHFADYAARLEAMPRAIDEQIEQMKLGLAASRVPPRVVLSKTPELVAALGEGKFVEDPATSPFYRPFLSRSKDDPAAARARTAIAQGIVPAFRRLGVFLETYIPRCRETLGISEGVDGAAAYEYRLRLHTTTKLTAQQIHDLGLREVARLRAEMMSVIAETDFPKKNDLKGDELFAAFLAYLRTDPRFYYTDARTMLAGYRDLTKRIDPELPKLFGTLPRLTYGVREIPDFAADGSPAAYCYPGSIRSGVPGYFMVNASHLDQRPKYGMVSLTLHESVPGHHFQLSLIDEVEDLHPFRRLVDCTAYVEGWALYCERLGLEMGENPAPGGRGLYADPYDNFGRLSDEIWRACRLVVDTGLHTFRWPRQKAIDYMLANTAGTTVDIESEVDRYIGWPGQACAYKVGQLKILELRERAEKALGATFDVRAFHDMILSGGSLPMDVLEQRAERWIRAGGG